MSKWTRILAAAVLLAAGMTASAQPATRPTTRPATQPATWPTTAPGIPAGLEKLVETLKEGEPAFTADQANAMAKEALPLIEKITGRKLKKMPALKLVGRDALAKVLAKDLAPQLKRLMPDASAQHVEHVASMTGAMLAPCVLGKYGLTDGVLYLLPRNLPPLLKLGKVDAKHTAAIARILIAHELTHALQDQEIGLASSIERTKGLDAIQAFQATIEGHAVFVQDAVGKAVGLDEAALAVSRLMAAGAVELDDPALEMIGRVVAAQFEQIYLGGRKFIAYHHARGGHGRVWQILAAPPTTTAMIAHPETYSPHAPARPDYAKALEGVEKDFGQGPWQVQNVEVGRMMLNAVYAQMDPAVRKEIVAGIAHAQALVATAAPGGKPAMANVTVIEFTDPAGAKKAIAAQEELARKNVERLRTSTMLTVEAASFENVPAVRADVARKAAIRIKMLGGTAIETVIHRIARGKIMLEITSIDLGLDDKKLVAIAEKVFKRIAGLAESPHP